MERLSRRDTSFRTLNEILINTRNELKYELKSVEIRDAASPFSHYFGKLKSTSKLTSKGLCCVSIRKSQQNAVTFVTADG